MWDWIKNMFNKFIKACKDLLNLAFPLARQVIIGQLKDIALNAVKELSTADLNNEEKRKEAFKRIKDYALNNAIPARDSLINALIELTVLSFKKEF